MFCPVCESEYQPGITHCPDDDVELVERLNPEASHDDSGARFVSLHHLGFAGRGRDGQRYPGTKWHPCGRSVRQF